MKFTGDKSIERKMVEVMTKADFIDKVAKITNEPKKTVSMVVEGLFECIEDALVDGESCKFAGFGVFEVKNRAPREGRNPRNPSQIVPIPAKRVPHFRPGKSLKKRVLV